MKWKTAFENKRNTWVASVFIFRRPLSKGFTKPVCHSKMKKKEIRPQKGLLRGQTGAEDTSCFASSCLRLSLNKRQRETTDNKRDAHEAWLGKETR
jgi:hypothetical protein